MYQHVVSSIVASAGIVMDVHVPTYSVKYIGVGRNRYGRPCWSSEVTSARNEIVLLSKTINNKFLVAMLKVQKLASEISLHFNICASFEFLHIAEVSD